MAALEAWCVWHIIPLACRDFYMDFRQLAQPKGIPVASGTDTLSCSPIKEQGLYV